MLHSQLQCVKMLCVDVLEPVDGRERRGEQRNGERAEYIKSRALRVVNGVERAWKKKCGGSAQWESGHLRRSMHTPNTPQSSHGLFQSV